MGQAILSRMDQRRLQLFNRALSKITNDICGPAAHWQTVTGDLGLVESQAKDVICRFLTYREDVMFLATAGLIEPPPVYMHGQDPKLYADQIAEIPVNEHGVQMLSIAINCGLYIELYITNVTFVMDVINFVKGIELMEVPPELISALNMPNAA